MAMKIADYRDRKDSIGGSITCVIRNCPIGLGEPVFDKLEALLAHAMLSIPSTKGFEIGSGFDGMYVIYIVRFRETGLVLLHLKSIRRWG